MEIDLTRSEVAAVAERVFRHRPWFFGSLITAAHFAAHVYTRYRGMDRHFLKAARRDQKPVVDLETLHEQFHAFIGLYPRLNSSSCWFAPSQRLAPASAVPASPSIKPDRYVTAFGVYERSRSNTSWSRAHTISHKSVNSALSAAISSNVVTHMKTTIDIADPLLEAAKKTAAREGTTLRALVELGLRQVLDSRRQGEGFRLRKASFRGQGLQPAAKDLSWEQMRELAYGERTR